MMAFKGLYLTTMMCLTIRLANSYSQESCKQIKDRYPYAPSGIYHIQAGSYNLIEVYCEMGLNGGGYTFLSPRAMTDITHEELQSIITDRKSVLMRIRRCDGTQSYSVLEQLPQYKSIPLFIGISNSTGFTAAGNIPVIGSPYFFVGFLPTSTPAFNGAIQGIVGNSVSYTFANCWPTTTNSHIAMFPNFSEKTPTDYLFSVEWPFCNNLFNAAAVNPSGRIMPPEYFMFTEFHFGGCGCYTQTDARLRKKCILGFQIGFR